MDLKLRLMCIACLGSILAEEDIKLPLCPTNIDYLPQELPMHCRMPRRADLKGLPLSVPSGLQLPSYQDKDNQQNSMAGAPGFTYPGGLPPGGPPGGHFAIPMPVMPMPQPAHKLPVIVMPFYSPDPAFKNSQKSQGPSKEFSKKQRQRPRKPRHSRRPQLHHSGTETDTDDTDTDTDDSSSDTSSDTSADGGFTSGDGGWWNKNKRGRKSGRRSIRNHVHKSKRKQAKHKDLLTPVLQYVTKDGYVIFEKEISKNEAKDWLRIKQGNEESSERSHNEDSEKEDVKEYKSKEETVTTFETKREKSTEKTNVQKKHVHHLKPNTLN